MNTGPVTWAAPVVAVAMLLVGGSARGQDRLVITENSSSSLTATFNGASIPAADIVNIRSDDWTINVPGIITGLLGRSTWSEPGSTTAANILIAGGPSGAFTVDVFSDGGGSVIENVYGTTDLSDFHIGTASLFVTFNDNGDPVPDAATTLSLLSLSFAGLGVLARKKVGV